MAVAAALSTTVISVEPGSDAVCEVQIRNTGDVVDQFTVDVVGDATDWCTVEPSIINLLPGGAATATATFAPPRSAEVPAGMTDFGIRVRSREDPDGSTVQEGEVDVAPFSELAAELVPVKRRGRRRAKFRLAVDNNGNHEISTDIMAVDPDDEMQIQLRPHTVRLERGTAVVVRLKTVPHKRFLRGDTKTLPFQALVLAPGEEPVTADGVMIQEQLLPKWLLPALALLAAAGAVLVALWFLLLRPQVQTIAKAEAQQQVSQAASAAQQAGQAAQQASKAAQVAQSAAGGGSGSGSGVGSGSGAGGAAGGGAGHPGSGGSGPSATGSAGSAGSSGSSGTNNTSFRIASSAKPVTDGSVQNFVYTAPDHQTLDITDIVLQNPRGDAGILRILFGQTVVLEEGLNNFRDLDYHYVVPLHVTADQPVTVAVNCVTPGTGTTCTPSVSFSGRAGK
jgi:hypothetical protein